MPKVSVVVPVYNVEPFIEKCARSLFAQTLDEIEYIFIDDCSKDGSVQLIKQIVHDYPKREHYVKIIEHQENTGVAVARKDGIAVATGDFIIHCDSDDWVDADMYEVLYNEAIRKGADIVCCTFTTERKDSRQIGHIDYEVETKENMAFDIPPLYGSLCNKLIRRSIIIENNVDFFPEINMGEDFGYVFQCRYFSKKTLYLDNPLYHYNLQNESSICTTMNGEKSFQIVKLASCIEHFLLSQGDFKPFEVRMAYLKFQSKYEFLNNPNVLDLHRWRTLFPEVNWKALSFKKAPLNLRILALLAAMHLDFVVCLLLKLKYN